MGPSRALAVPSALLCTLASACAGEPIRPFPPRAAVWVDPDQRPYSPPPPSFYSPYIWDGANYSVFRPLSHVWKFETGREAANVNAFDEVPDSSWFTNRIGMKSIPPAEAARGACGDRPDGVMRPWTITGGKPDGASPGFLAQDAMGRKFLAKTDGAAQPERPTAADAIGSALFHVVGYFAPCNRVVEVAPEDLMLKPGAEVKRTSGAKEAMTQGHVDAVLKIATRTSSGAYRMGMSEFIGGRPISPWRFEGVWDEDPNDVIPHEDRREVRGMVVLAAWINHIDSRQENNLASWISGPDGKGHVRHYKLDVGDSFGIIQGPDGFPPRFGHTGYLDLGHVATDFVTLGAIERPWERAQLGPAGKVLGYFSERDFDPDDWRPGYPNPAFEAAQEGDKAWMARIIARIGPEHVRALVARGHWTAPHAEEELVRVLLARRQILLERYLTRLSPLTAPRLQGREVCAEDLLVSTGLRAAEARKYEAWTRGATDDRWTAAVVSRRPEGPCAALPATPTGPLFVDLSSDTEGPLRLHLYPQGDGWLLAGAERPRMSSR